MTFLAGLQMISKEALESAMIDGANRFQTLLFITIPMLGPILKIILMLAGASIAIIPILIVYFFTNKQFISRLTSGSVKG